MKPGSKVKTINVLMFGWEFPPHKTGGLGTACKGITYGLSKINNLHLSLVVPRVFGDEEADGSELIGANKIKVNFGSLAQMGQEKNSFSEIKVDSNLTPYTSPDEYWRKINDKQVSHFNLIPTTSKGHIRFTGKYGPDLYKEVANYSVVARTIANQKKYDIIHAHDWLTIPAALEAKCKTNTPLILHIHATEFDRSGESINPQIFAIEKEGMEKADVIIAVSHYTKNIVINRYQIPPEKIRVVHNGVMPFNSKESKKNIGKNKIVTFLGRITQQKGPEYFIESAAIVLKQTPNVTFIMAGHGDLLDKMITKVSELGISDHVKFTGFLKDDEVQRLLNMTDLLVMPSKSEPFGIVALEAIQHKIPIIISKTSGVTEVLKHVVKVDNYDIQEIAQMTIHLLSHPIISQKMVTDSLNDLAHLTWEKATRKLAQIYTRQLQNTN